MLNVATGIDNFFPAEFVYKRIELLDTPESTLPVDHIVDFLSKERSESARIFVHCNAGVSRSAAAVIAYLMQRDGLDYGAALTAVKAKRPAARPNDGFAKQLKSLETSVRNHV